MQLEDYTYEIDSNDSNKIWFILNRFPGIKFSYIELVVGDEHPNESVDIRFALDIKVDITQKEILEQQLKSDEFCNSVKELLQDIVAATIIDQRRNSEEKI